MYVVDYEYQADLKAYKVNQSYKAKGNSGLWYLTKNSYQAEKKLFFVRYKYQADFTVYFVDYDYQSGWRNEEQKHLLN